MAAEVAVSLPALDGLLMVPILQPLAAALLLLRAAALAADAAAAPALAVATNERGGPRRGSIEQPSMVVRQYNTHYRASCHAVCQQTEQAAKRMYGGSNVGEANTSGW